MATHLEVTQALINSLQAEQIGQLLELLLALQEGDEPACSGFGEVPPHREVRNLLAQAHEAAVECQSLLLRATSAMNHHWTQAIPPLDEMDRRAKEHKLGYYLRESLAVRQSCVKLQLLEGRQTKF